MQKKSKNQKIIEIKLLFKTLIEETFGNLCLYSLLGGSVAFNIDNNKSDLDCLVVLKDEAYEDCKIIRKINRFTDGYLKIHSIYGHTPDLNFPGDIISESQKEDALCGRGFVNGGNVNVSPILTDEDWDKPDVDFRVWLTEIAFNNGMFLIGDFDCYQRDSMRAINLILKVMLLLCSMDNLNANTVTDEIFKRGKAFLGLSEKYYLTYKDQLKILFEYSFLILEETGYVVRNRAYYSLNFLMLKEWEGYILKKFNEKKSKYIVEWQVVRDYIKVLDTTK